MVTPHRLTGLVLLCLIPAFTPVHAGFEGRYLPSQIGQGAKPGGQGLNPASDAWLNTAGFSVSAFRPFGLTELQTTAASGNWAVSRWNILGGFFRMGDDRYNETTVSAGGAARLTDAIAAGLILNYHHLTISGIAGVNAWSADGGLQVQIWPAVTLGTAVTNLFQNQLGNGDEMLPVVWRSGFWLTLTDWISGGVDWVSEADHDPDCQISLQTTPMERLELMAAFSTLTGHWSAGVTGEWLPVATSWVVSVHPQLGLTHQVTIRFGLSDDPPDQPVLISDERNDINKVPVLPVVSLVDLNTDDPSHWDQLPGVSRVLAQRIVDWKIKRGGLMSPDELMGVEGMTSTILESIRPYIRVHSVQQAPASP